MKREIGNRLHREKGYSSNPNPNVLSAPKEFYSVNRKTPIKMRAKMYNLDLYVGDNENEPNSNYQLNELNVMDRQNREVDTKEELKIASSHPSTPLHKNLSNSLDLDLKDNNASRAPNIDINSGTDAIDPPRQTIQYHPSDPRSRLAGNKLPGLTAYAPIVPEDIQSKNQRGPPKLNVKNEDTLYPNAQNTHLKTNKSPLENRVQPNDKILARSCIQCITRTTEQQSYPKQSFSNPQSQVTAEETNIQNANISDSYNKIISTVDPKSLLRQSNSNNEFSIPPIKIGNKPTQTISNKNMASGENSQEDENINVGIEMKVDDTHGSISRDSKTSIRTSDPIDIPPNTTLPPNLRIHHSTALPSDVQHIISTIYTDVCPRPRRIRDIDPCGCRPNRNFPYACSDLDCVLYACQEECQSNCEAGETCQNKRITRMLWKKVEVFDAGMKGRGLRALEKIRKGDFITEYVGIATLKKELDSLFQQYQKEQMLYIMALDNEVYLDARTKGSVARYINHGCDPNCKVDRWKVQGITRAGVFALRDIEEGEELMFDYKWDRRRGRAPTKCYCMASNCRGTLELKKNKDLEEEEIEMKLKGYWKKPNFSSEVREEIVNRVIKVYFEGNREYYVADVSKYDPNTKMHMIIYKTDMEESWENLNKVDWMILDEEAEHIEIKRKEKKADTAQFSNSIQNPSYQTLKKSSLKNYVIVQNIEREELARKFIIDKCQRYFRVHINITPCIRNNSVVGEEEALEEENALKDSKDGLAWKLTVVGLDPWKAMNYLQKNVDILRVNVGTAKEASSSSVLPSSTHIVSHETITVEKNDGIGMYSNVAKLSNTDSVDSSRVSQEMVIPRLIADEVKKELFLLRSKCWNVTINFTKLQTRSKIVARLLLSASLPHDLKRAQTVLWIEMLRICGEKGLHYNANEGKDHVNPKELGFLGGELSKCEWEQFLGYGEDYQLTVKNSDSLSPYQYMKQKLIDSKILRDFQRIHKCTIWVQPESENRPNENLLLPNSSEVSGIARVFIGCEPDRVPEVWLHIVARVNDLNRGVKFFPLVKDNYFKHLLEDNNLKWDNLARKLNSYRENHICRSLLHFLHKVIGVKVELDPSTNSYLRIEMNSDSASSLKNHNEQVFESTSSDQGDIFDLQSQPKSAPVIPFHPSTGNERNSFATSKPIDKILEAERILQAQLHVYRDHLQRRQQWMFGRDWRLLENTSISIDLPASHSSNMTNALDLKAVPTSIEEISDIVSRLSLHPTVAAHASVIFYRYIHIFESNSTDMKNEFKLRELLTACVFLANKAQKVTKWKRLEVVLQAAYHTFYSGRNLNIESEEAKRLEARILSAENLILKTLQYDIFWEGVDWIIASVAPYIPKDIANRAIEIVLTSPILSMGPSIWLWCGPVYAFASIVGFVRNDFLRSMISGMELNPSKMIQVLDLVKKAVISVPLSRYEKLGKTAQLYKSLEAKILKNMFLVKSLCMTESSTPIGFDDIWANIISKSKELMFLHKMKTEARFHRGMKGLDSNLISQTILPSLRIISSQSGCSIFFEDVIGSNPKKENIIIEGSWRSISTAEYLIERLHYSTHSIDGRDEATNRISEGESEAGTDFGALQSVSPQFEIQNASLVAPSPTLSISSSSTLSSSFPKQNTFHSSIQKDEDIITKKIILSESEGRILPCVLRTSDLIIADDTSHLSSSKSLEMKNFLCGNISEQRMIKAGLRWWLSPRLGVSEKGALCDILYLLSRSNATSVPFQKKLFEFLGIMGYDSITGDLGKVESNKMDENGGDNLIDISFQRWPSIKAETKERSKKSSGDRKHTMNMGFSAAALQEMQLLRQIHSQIKIPQGHPNFFLPLGVAIPFESNKKVQSNSLESNLSHNVLSNNIVSNIFQDNKSEKLSADPQLCPDSFFLIFERTPVALQKVLAYSKKKRKSLAKSTFISPALFCAWFYDILSALACSHLNNMVLRTVHAEQVLINEIGEFKVSNLVRTLVLPHDERDKSMDPLQSARNAKKMGLQSNNDLCNNPYISPEMLLGSQNYTKESDVWSIGCLMAHLLVNKSLFSGFQDRFVHMRAIFKVVGTPSNSNYPDAKRFPHYERCKPEKDYKKGVRKALKFHLKDCKEEHLQEYVGAMDLLEKMLDLDPKKRIKPIDALQHTYMKNFVLRRKTRQFRQQFQRDWIKLKKELLGEQRSSKITSKLQPDPVKPMSPVLDKNHDKRRKHMVLEATKIGDDDDDLYNLSEEDLMNFGQNKGRKRMKTLNI